jgi:hypothetical protein
MVQVEEMTGNTVQKLTPSVEVKRDGIGGSGTKKDASS